MDKIYDVGIIGAGIAGASLAILLAKDGYSVVVFERDRFPRHKVCGEYVAMEAWNFMTYLGVDLGSMSLPKITTLTLTSQKGCKVQEVLKPGGFGISRYALDMELMKIMRQCGVDVHENTKVFDADFNSISTDSGITKCRLVAGAFGKYRPSFSHSKQRPSKNKFIGIKYHVKTTSAAILKTNEIALHSFDGGYCGISEVENNRICLCYLVHADQLKNCDNHIETLEKKVLHKNKFLFDIFNNTESYFDKPMIVSHINFQKIGTYSIPKGQIYLGDAAGSISPLSGNGMSMAARSAYELHHLIKQKGLNIMDLYPAYDVFWNKKIGKKVKMASILNQVMINPGLNHFVLNVLKKQSWARDRVIKSMQGDSIHLN